MKSLERTEFFCHLQPLRVSVGMHLRQCISFHRANGSNYELAQERRDVKLHLHHRC